MKASKRKNLVSVLLAGALGVAALLFHEPLIDWFTGGRGAHAPGGVDGGGGKAAPAHAFSPAALDRLQLAFSTYEQIRDELAHDSTRRLAELATPLAGQLREIASKERGLPPRIAGALNGAADAAEKLAEAGGRGDIEAARARFGEVSRGMVAVALEDPRVAAGWSLFECPMAKGFKQWLQPDARMANPYMGQRMLECGSAKSLEDEAEAARAASAVAGDPGEIAWYTCPMHPSVRQSGPGRCPICGMDLVPVTKGDLATGTVTVDEVRRQLIGVRVEPVKRAPLVTSIRTVGEVKYDETALFDVTLKVRGWIRDLRVDRTGQPVKKGEVLFRLYSPELYAAQQEYLLALRTRNGDVDDPLVRAARQRLSLWDIGPGQLDALRKRGEPMEALPIRAPASGYVIEKDVVEGAAVEPGMRLYRIAELDKVWIEAQVFESDLPFVKAGMPAEITVQALPGRTFHGKVSYVYPYLQGTTRTGQIRIELPNTDGALKPQMYADVAFRVDRGERLQVPSSAVIYTGPRRLVFVDLGEGRLRPREVKLGVRADDVWEVLGGLAEGERVVTSGNFLIAAESRLRSATEYWGSGPGEALEHEHP